MYPHTYYKVLKPVYRETGWNETRVNEETGRTFELRWQAVSFVLVGWAESIEDAKRKYPYLLNPVLEPVGFFPKELKEPPEEKHRRVIEESHEAA